jgi:branched-chain amino acid transport system permease protein
MTVAPDLILQLVVSGLAVGGAYAFIAVGFVTIHAVTGCINFAQGEFAMLGALVAAAGYQAGLALPLAALVGVALAVVSALAVERTALATVRSRSPLIVLVMTVAASGVLRGGALLAFGPVPLGLPAFIAGPPVALGSAIVSRQEVCVLGLSAVAISLLFLFFRRTSAGVAMRAAAANPTASRLVGISPGSMAVLAFGLSGLLGGLAGVAVAPITLASYEMGLGLGLKGFVAAVLGGIDSAPGAVLGGLLLGVLESVAAGLLSSGYKDAFAFGVLLLALVFRPRGLLATAWQRKA